MTHVQIVKANGEKEFFDPSKLEKSLRRAGAHDAVIADILVKIQSELSEGDTTKDIYRKAFKLLGKTNQPVAANYSLRRAVMDMGPSGFPFEQLIAEIFRAQGYDVATGVQVQGKCTTHEVDVAAWKENELHLIEAKFHNQPGVKTDTKVALYVKARYDDLTDIDIEIGGMTRRLTQGWLFTNTKFTTGAIDYGMCQHINMVGWNYPQKGSLQDLIIETKLHPLTCLTETSQAEENMLLKQNIVLLRQLKAQPEALDPLGMSLERKKEVLEEVDMVING